MKHDHTGDRKHLLILREVPTQTPWVHRLEKIMRRVVETTTVILHHVTHKSLNSEDMRVGAEPVTPHASTSSGEFM